MSDKNKKNDSAFDFSTSHELRMATYVCEQEINKSDANIANLKAELEKAQNYYIELQSSKVKKASFKPKAAKCTRKNQGATLKSSTDTNLDRSVSSNIDKKSASKSSETKKLEQTNTSQFEYENLDFGENDHRTKEEKWDVIKRRIDQQFPPELRQEPSGTKTNKKKKSDFSTAQKKNAVRFKTPAPPKAKQKPIDYSKLNLPRQTIDYTKIKPRIVCRFASDKPEPEPLQETGGIPILPNKQDDEYENDWEEYELSREDETIKEKSENDQSSSKKSNQSSKKTNQSSKKTNQSEKVESHKSKRAKDSNNNSQSISSIGTDEKQKTDTNISISYNDTKSSQDTTLVPSRLSDDSFVCSLVETEISKLLETGNISINDVPAIVKQYTREIVHVEDLPREMILGFLLFHFEIKDPATNKPYHYDEFILSKLHEERQKLETKLEQEQKLRGLLPKNKVVKPKSPVKSTTIKKKITVVELFHRYARKHDIAQFPDSKKQENGDFGVPDESTTNVNFQGDKPKELLDEHIQKETIKHTNNRSGSSNTNKSTKNSYMDFLEETQSKLKLEKKNLDTMDRLADYSDYVPASKENVDEVLDQEMQMDKESIDSDETCFIPFHIENDKKDTNTTKNLKSVSEDSLDSFEKESVKGFSDSQNNEDSNTPSKLFFVIDTLNEPELNHKFILRLRMKSITWEKMLKITKVKVRFLNSFNKQYSTVNKEYILPYLCISDVICNMFYVCPPSTFSSQLVRNPPHMALIKSGTNDVLMKGFLELESVHFGLSKDVFNSRILLYGTNKVLVGKLKMFVKVQDLGSASEEYTNGYCGCSLKMLEDKQIKVTNGIIRTVTNVAAIQKHVHKAFDRVLFKVDNIASKSCYNLSETPVKHRKKKERKEEEIRKKNPIFDFNDEMGDQSIVHNAEKDIKNDPPAFISTNKNTKSYSLPRIEDILPKTDNIKEAEKYHQAILERLEKVNEICEEDLACFRKYNPDYPLDSFDKVGKKHRQSSKIKSEKSSISKQCEQTELHADKSKCTTCNTNVLKPDSTTQTLLKEAADKLVDYKTKSVEDKMDIMLNQILYLRKKMNDAEKDHQVKIVADEIRADFSVLSDNIRAIRGKYETDKLLVLNKELISLNRKITRLFMTQKSNVKKHTKGDACCTHHPDKKVDKSESIKYIQSEDNTANFGDKTPVEERRTFKFKTVLAPRPLRRRKNFMLEYYKKKSEKKASESLKKSDLVLQEEVYEGDISESFGPDIYLETKKYATVDPDVLLIVNENAGEGDWTSLDVSDFSEYDQPDRQYYKNCLNQLSDQLGDVKRKLLEYFQLREDLVVKQGGKADEKTTLQITKNIRILTVKYKRLKNAIKEMKAKF